MHSKKLQLLRTVITEQEIQSILLRLPKKRKDIGRVAIDGETGKSEDRKRKRSNNDRPGNGERA